MTVERDLTDADNLAANRNGTLTEGQRREAGQLAIGRDGWWIIGLILLSGPVETILKPFQPPTALLATTRLVMWGAALALALRILAQWLAQRQDVAAGEVRHANGSVAWRRSHYAAEFPGRPFWASNTVRNLLPGAYSFYYLPRSGIVLSAARSARVTAEADDLEALNEVLEKAAGFGADDIEHNRAGRLGPGQVLNWAVWLAVVVGMALGCSALLYFAAPYVLNSLRSAPLFDWVMVALMGLMILFLALSFAWAAFVLARELLDRRVSFVDGPIQRTTYSIGIGKRTLNEFRVNDMKFPIAPSTNEALLDGIVYRVYYAARSKGLVALEAIGQVEAGSRASEIKSEVGVA